MTFFFFFFFYTGSERRLRKQPDFPIESGTIAHPDTGALKGDGDLKYGRFLRGTRHDPGENVVKYGHKL